MNLEFGADAEAWRQEVRDFIAEKLPKKTQYKGENGIEVTRDEIMHWHKCLYERGWIVPNWPKEHGGPGWTPVQKYIFDEEISLASAPRPISFGITMCGPVLMKFGTQKQKDYFLPRIRSADVTFCQGYSEPGSGSDLASLKTRCEDKGDHWLVNGQKIWTTAAHHADWIFCLVRTDSSGKNQEGISFILIDMATPGVTVRPLITIEGTREVNEVFFSDVKVPKENMVGQVNMGWTIAKYLLGHERMGGGALGGQKKLLRQLKDIAAKEVSDGLPLDQNDTFRRKMSQVEIELMTLEIQMLRLLATVSADKEMGLESSMIKIRRSEIQQALTELKMEAVGYYSQPFQLSAMQHGWNEEPVGAEYANTLSAIYFNNRKVSIFAGSNEIQHNIIAKRMLNL